MSEADERMTEVVPVDLADAREGDVAVLIGRVMPGRTESTFRVLLPWAQAVVVTQFQDLEGVTVLRAVPSATSVTPVGGPHSPETTVPRLSDSPEGPEALREALASARRELAEAHEVIERLMSQRPTAGVCGCPAGRFDAQGLCTNADCEHPVERHASGRCDVPPTDAPDVWDASVAPGGLVCSVCRTPVESEPCREHQPAAWEAMT